MRGPPCSLTISPVCQGVSTGCLCRLLRQAAVEAAGDIFSGDLHIGQAAALSSTLLHKLCHGVQRLCVLEVRADLPCFLEGTGIWQLSVSAQGAVASAQADRVLRQCPSVTALACNHGFWPHLWPPNLRVLVLSTFQFDSYTLADFAEMQHVQLLRLQDASWLERLVLHSGTVCHWPAALASSLPGSLQEVQVSIDTESKPCGPEAGQQAQLEDLVSVDLSAFSQAAGCAAQLHVSVDASPEEPRDEEEELALVAAILAGLSTLACFQSFTLSCTTAALPAHIAALNQLQCCCCRLALDGDGASHIAQLPAFEHLTVTRRTADDNGPVSFMWAALASPGVRCLGSASRPVLDESIIGCTGLPAHDAPWALVVWGDMSDVQGLPVHCFVEEAPGKHVWRNAAAAGLEVDDTMPELQWGIDTFAAS